jgi:hypothetical protein
MDSLADKNEGNVVRRWLRPLLTFLAVGGVALIIWLIAVPYINGRQNSRELLVTPNLALGFAKPYLPVAVLSEKDLRELVDRATKECIEAGIYDPVHDMSGLVEFERSLIGFDFSRECLILVPVMHGYDYKVDMGSPYLASRKFTCQVRVHDPPWWQGVRHPASQTDVFCVAVRRDSAEMVEVWIRGKQAASLPLQ